MYLEVHMSAHVIHEAESSRQHARYKIPTKLIVAGKYYNVEEWSVSGLSIRLPETLIQASHIKVKMVFDFGDIHTVLDVELEKLHIDKESLKVGYRFVNLKQSQIAIFHHVINAYLGGEIIDAGEVIEIVKRDAFSVKRDNQLSPISSGKGNFLFQFKRIFGALALLLALIGILSIISYNVYQSLFVVKSIAANINAPVMVVRSPIASYFKAFPVVKNNNKVSPGELLATLQLINGGAANIESPCHCEIIKIHTPYKQFVDEGEPLITLLPVENGDLFIEAKFNYKDISKLSINQQAEIKFVNGQVVTGVVTKIMSAETVELRHAAPLKNVSSTPVSYVRAIIKPDAKLNIDLLGSAATVIIDSFVAADKR